VISTTRRYYRQVLIQVNDFERDLLSLPARLGGMGIMNPTELNEIASTNSMYISEPLVRRVQRQEFALDPYALQKIVKELRKEVDKGCDRRNAEKLDMLKESDFATPAINIALKACSVKGASSWVTAYPNYEHGTVLHKGDFTDAVCLRYGWPPPGLPLICKCGAPFSVQHALDCALGGFRIVQHNETRDVVVDCMKEAGYGDVVKEPKLQPLTGEKFKYLSANCDADARSDIKCCGFWREQRQAFFDVKVVSPCQKLFQSDNRATF